MTTRRVMTSEDRARTAQQQGLRFSVEGLQAKGINPGVVITNHMKTEDAIREQQAQDRQRRQDLEQDKREAFRKMTAADTEAVLDAARKEEPADLDANPLPAIEAELDLVGRRLKAYEIGLQTLQVQMTEELVNGNYMGKLQKLWEKEAAWEPSASTTYSEMKAHEGVMEELAIFATPLVLATAINEEGALTPEEMRYLRKAVKALPPQLPTLAGLREKTRSAVATLPLNADTDRRKAEKEAERAQRVQEVGAAARARAGTEEKFAAIQEEAEVKSEDMAEAIA